MRPHGFTLLELLVALTVCALLSGAIVGVIAPARAAFDSTPAALDLHQRARTGLDFLATTIRSAGTNVSAAAALGTLGSAMPTVIPLLADPATSGDGEFAGIVVVTVVPGGAQGLLAIDQPGANGLLTLAPSPSCPQLPDVCGFTRGATAAIADGSGRFDLFEVASADASSRQVVPEARLTAAFPAGAVVVEVQTSRIELRSQADGSRSLSRMTAGGAVEPIIDGVLHAGIEPWGDASAPRLEWDGHTGWSSYGPRPRIPDLETCVVTYQAGEPVSRLATFGEAATLVALRRADLEDGPWCPGGVDGDGYDADLFRLRRIDIWLRVEVLSAMFRGPAGRLFSRGGAGAQTPARWVPDRLVRATVALRNRR